MKLHELSPAEGSVKSAWRKGRGAGSGKEKDIRVRTLAPAAVSVPVSKAVSFPCTESFLKEASTTRTLLRTTLALTLMYSTDSMTETL